MSWFAEIRRKDHRMCRRCEMGPTHVYQPDVARVEETSAGDLPQPTGTPLCNACLAARMEQDLSTYGGRCLLFEPALGPECLVFIPLGSAAPRAALDRAGGPCAECGATGHFGWIPVEPDANLWGEHWLPALSSGELSVSDALCGACASRRLMRSIEERGLYFEGITIPTGGGDGALLCAEI